MIVCWSSFNNKDVFSAATFFPYLCSTSQARSTFFLVLSVCPQLLLFTPPEDLANSRRLTLVRRLPALRYNYIRQSHSPQPTGTGIMDDGEWDSPLDGNEALVRIESRPDVLTTRSPLSQRNLRRQSRVSVNSQSITFTGGSRPS